MSQLQRWLFDPLEEEGNTMPFSRMDVIWSAVLGLGLMFAVSFAMQLISPHEPFGHLEKRNFAISSAACIAILLLNARRRMIFGAALGILAMRLVVGVLFVNHGPLMIGLLLFTVVGTYLFLRDI